MRHAPLTLVLCVVFAPSANAQMSGGYAGFTFGEFRYAQDSQVFARTFSDDGGLFGVFGGYRFSDNFALEGSWTGTGDLNILDWFFGPSSTSVQEEYNIRTVRALGIAQLGKFGLFGGLGIHASHGEASATVGKTAVDLDADDSGATAVVGAQLDGRLFSYRCQYEWLDADDGRDLSSFTIGWVFRF